VGVEYWNNGYCTEACKSIIDFGFNELNLNRIGAKHFSRNPASGKVLTNCGLVYISSDSEQIGNMKQIEDFKWYELLRT
jgi:RimJ/RimL family protein N-acetyltransferase